MSAVRVNPTNTRGGGASALLRDRASLNGVGTFTRVRVLEKAVGILNLFGPDRAELDIQQIRRATRLPNSTCIRLVRNLEKDGLLSRNRTGYRIGVAVLRWAAAARWQFGTIEVISPIIRRLRDETRETVGLFIRNGAFRVCVDIAETPRAIGHRLHVGHVLPLHVGSAGKVLLAFDPVAQAMIDPLSLQRYTPRTIGSYRRLRSALRQIQTKGYAVALGEWDAELNGIAAPVFGPDGNVIAAIGISAPAQRMGPARVRLHLRSLLRAAREASSELGHLPAPTH